MSTARGDHSDRLRNLFVSYGSYHDNIVNKIIHIVCVPLILTASGALLEHLRFTVGPVKPDLSFYSLLVALLYYVSLDKVAGGIAAVLYLVLWRVQRHYFQVDPASHLKISFAIWAVSWILQFIGHGVYEKRKPALLDNALQVFSAPMFVVVEVMFLLGWRKDFHDECSASIKDEIKRLRASTKQ